MKGRRASYVVMAGLFVAGWSILPAGAADAPGSPTGATAAMRVYVDPSTGRPAPPPEPQSEAAEVVEPTPTAEVPVERPAPGGGTMVRLPDSYKRPLALTVGPDGVAHVGHAPAGTPAAAR